MYYDLVKKILELTSAGYTIRMTPFMNDECVEIRLTKNGRSVARIFDPQERKQSSAWGTDDECIGFHLTILECELQDYMETHKED